MRKPDDPVAVVDQIRANYLTAFMKAVKPYTVKVGSCLVQPCLSDSLELIIGREGLKFPMRQDLVPLKDGNPKQVNVVKEAQPLTFDCFTVECDGLEIAFGPFTWDLCTVAGVDLPKKLDYGPLKEWFTTYFDMEDSFDPEPETGLRPVIHSLNGPYINELLTVFVADLGTTPVQGLDELIWTLRDMGAKAVIVGDWQPDPEDAAD
jgi:hypothetical protein